MDLEISVDELRKRKLFVATPCYGGMCHSLYCKSIADLHVTMFKYGIDLKYFALINESLISRARNYASDEFLRSDATHMLFIDSDIEFNPQDVLALLALADPESDKDVVCGPYPKKNISWEKIRAAVDKGLAEENPNILEHFVGDLVFNPINSGSFDISVPLEVKESGTGFMMIQRRVFDRFKEAHPELSYMPDHVRTKQFDGSREIMAYFNDPVDPVSKRFLSEDYWFCQEIRKLGMKVFLCPWMSLGHMGYYKFVSNMRALASAGVSPTADDTSPKE